MRSRSLGVLTVLFVVAGVVVAPCLAMACCPPAAASSHAGGVAVELSTENHSVTASHCDGRSDATAPTFSPALAQAHESGPGCCAIGAENLPVLELDAALSAPAGPRGETPPAFAAWSLVSRAPAIGEPPDDRVSIGGGRSLLGLHCVLLI